MPHRQNAAPGEPRSSIPARRHTGVLLALVAAGGSVGAPARYVLEQMGADRAVLWPWPTFAINVAGAFALGLLLETLARSGPDTGRRQRVRLLVGTGFLGTFTTYSSLAVEVDLLVYRSNMWVAVGYLAASVVSGLVAVGIGIAAAAALTTKRAGQDSSP